MTHTYNISGMTCSGCQAKVQSLLSQVKGIKNVAIDLSTGEATIDMDKHVPVDILQAALKDHPRYHLSEKAHSLHSIDMGGEEEAKSWLETYRPVILIFAYITAATLLIEAARGGFSWARWLEHFMAGFFLVFSFFKLLDLRGFADSYATYDIIAKKWSGWGYMYAFIELALGLAFLSGFEPLATNIVTFVVMSISLVGVLQSLMHKRKIRCACLGAVFNLPMSTITVIEDALMIMMSLVMIYHFLTF